MEIKEVVEQLRAMARVENGEIMIVHGLENGMNELVYHVIVAVLRGYTLCKVDEALKKMDEEADYAYADFPEYAVATGLVDEEDDEKEAYSYDDFRYGLRRGIEILREACK